MAAQNAPVKTDIHRRTVRPFAGAPAVKRIIEKLPNSSKERRLNVDSLLNTDRSSHHVRSKIPPKFAAQTMQRGNETTIPKTCDQRAP
jgi:hypothetical protein